MNFESYVRKPFTVQAVQITRSNIEEVAEFIGTMEYKDDGTPYILVNKKKLPNSVEKIYIGSWMTKMNGSLRCYSRKIFREIFAKNTPEVQEWVDYLEGEKVEDTPEEKEEKVGPIRGR